MTDDSGLTARHLSIELNNWAESRVRLPWLSIVM